MSSNSGFGLGAGLSNSNMFEDRLTPSQPSPFSVTGMEESDDESGKLDFSSFFQNAILEQTSKMNSPFYKTAEPILDALKTGAPIDKDTIKTMLENLLDVAEKLLENIQSIDSEPSQVQQRTVRLIELKKTLNGIFDMGTIHKTPHAVATLAKLYKKLPSQTDSMVSTLFFQYTEMKSFPSNTDSNDDNQRKDVHYFQFQMITVMDIESKVGDQGSEKLSILRQQLMSYSSIITSLDVVNALPEKTISHLEDAAIDAVMHNISDDPTDEESTTVSDDAISLGDSDITSTIS